LLFVNLCLVVTVGWDVEKVGVYMSWEVHPIQGW